jgi:hypothetical protein
MNRLSWRASVLAVWCVCVLLCGTRAADEPTPKDYGKAEKFKGKTFDVKEKGQVAFILSFPAGRKATVTVKSKGKPDVNLFVWDADKKEVAKDDSPGPDCELNFTPETAGKFTLVIKNLGPGDTKSTVKVSLAKKGS